MSFGVKIPNKIMFSAFWSCFFYSSSFSLPDFPFLIASIYLCITLIFDFWVFSFWSSSEFIRLSKESAKLSATANFKVTVLKNFFLFYDVADFVWEENSLFPILILISTPWCGDPKSLNVSSYISFALGLSISDLGLNSWPLEI